MELKNSTGKQADRPYAVFCEQAYDIVRCIPSGKVMTYGGIASRIPKPEGIDSLAYSRIRARWVGYAMKSCPEDVPWWRVVNAKGQISQRMGHGPLVQRELLKEEDIHLNEAQVVDLETYEWKEDQ
ncbi:MAG: methyltransferase [Anaerolineales bacterium]|nr:methyltransferase [Anaerolineales bacterium]